MNSEMNCTLMHPLMFVRDLDAPPKRSRGRVRTRGRGRLTGHSRKSGFECGRAGVSEINQARDSFPRSFSIEPPWKSTCSVMTRSKNKRLLSEELALSESDSETEENDVTRRQDDQGKEKDGSDEDFAEPGSLINDLYISSDSSSSSSTTSEITGPSDSESEDSALPIKAAEPLLGTLKGLAYFCVHKASNPEVYEDFKATSLTEDPLTVINRFKQLCQDYPLDQAGLMFADKLKPLGLKKVVSLLRIFQPLFSENYFSQDMKSDLIFGNIIMTLIYHWDDRKLHPVNVTLLKLLTSYHLDPFKLRRFRKTYDNRLANQTISNETEIGVLCCETYFATDDMKHCVKFLQRALKNAIEEKLTSDLDHLTPLVKAVFSKLFNRRETLPLARLFSSIIDIQINLEYPIDLTLYYDGVLALNVAKDDRYCHKRAFNLFEKVNYWGYVEASEIAYRGLLIVAAQLNESPDRIVDIFRMCVNTGAYPQHDTSKWVISVYSSMSKIEIQIYLVHCLREYLKEIWSKRLKMCRTYLTFRVVQVPNLTRNHLHSAHPKLIQVDHSLPDAIRRLTMVVQYYLRTPADSCLHPYTEDKLVMFHGTVLELFKKALYINSIEMNQKNCVFCKKFSKDRQI